MVFIISCKIKDMNIKSEKLNKENTILKIDDTNAKLAGGGKEKINFNKIYEYIYYPYVYGVVCRIYKPVF